MKAISIWQPWASLINMKLKWVETRGWSTSYRGDLLICSAKKKDKLTRDYYYDNIRPYLHDVFPISSKCYYIDSSHGFYEYNNFPFGKALCIARLKDCQKIYPGLIKQYSKHEGYKIDYEHDEPETISRALGNEIRFGDWREGRYAWIFDDIIPLNFPFDVTGKLGLFDVVHPNLDYVALSWFNEYIEETCYDIDLFDSFLENNPGDDVSIIFRGNYQDCEKFLEHRLQ